MAREMPEPTTTAMSSTTSLDLNVIDEAFGEFADLYTDVLRVKSTSTPEQVQLAYFDRRSELFTLLAKLDSRAQDDSTLRQRIEAERRMDSVVLAVRILGDPQQRLRYDRLRKDRLYHRQRADHLEVNPASSGEGEFVKVKKEKKEKRRKPEKVKPTKQVKPKPKPKPKPTTFKTATKPPKPVNVSKGTTTSPTTTSPTSLNQSIATQDTEHDLTDEEGGPSVSRDLSMSMSMTLDTYDTRQDDGDMTMYTLTDPKLDDLDDTGYLSCITNSRIVRKISNEISGACEDTLVSVDQVFNAFTLTDKDIKAVTRRIHKAKRQLDG